MGVDDTGIDPAEPFVDDEDVDGLDLTPRTSVSPAAAGASGDRTKKVVLGGVLGLVVIALAFVAWQGLSNAALYFRNVDEAVEQRADLGDTRFRMQGTVVPGTVESGTTDAGATAVLFTVEHNGVEAAVRHVGDPPELFQPGIPVVLEGRWSMTADTFESDLILVKHSETYEEENPDRVDDYVGETPAAPVQPTDDDTDDDS